MLKLAASVLIVFSGGVFGLIVAQSYGTRLEQLKTFRGALTMLETEITYGLTPLPDALMSVGYHIEGCVGRFFAEVGSLLNQDQGPSSGEAWEQSLGLLQEEAAFTAGDTEILRQFGFSLGASDRENQIKNLKLIQEQLRNQESHAEKLRDNNQRMWRTLGFLAGLAVVFILY